MQIFVANPTKGNVSQKDDTMIFELNAELFKVCLAFQAHGIPVNAPEAQPFLRKLSSNLTWLAARVDNAKTTLEVEIPLPEMDPPVLAATAANLNIPAEILNRIHALYAQLPSFFAKDLARKERKANQGSGTPAPSISNHTSFALQLSGASGIQPHPRSSATPSILPPSGIGVKRERPDG
ncbi:hypothetical protein EW145_g8440, partial [Phellinidium pouzarii]